MPKDGSGFTPIGDILPSLVRPQHRPISRIEERLIEPVSEADPEVGFMARLLALCSLPRTNPGRQQAEPLDDSRVTAGSRAHAGVP